MTSYLSNLLTTTTSRYNSIRKALLSDELDGDTEDDSHITRVLRAYYTEKGRAFPQWLPPDPKAPQAAAPAAFVSSAGRSQTPLSANGGRPGGLSDLWDSAPQQQPPKQAPGSLRGGGGRTLQPRGGGGGIVDSYSQDAPQQGRPLPSQRAGSYQSQNSQSSSRFAAEPSPPPSAGSGSTAQERLKARLWGSSRTGSPAPSGSSGQSPVSSPGFSDSRGSYDRGGSFQSSRSPPADGGYNSGGYGGSGGGGGGGGGGGYDGGNTPYGGGQRPPGRERVGLPSGPRGLPSGPRLR